MGKRLVFVGGGHAHLTCLLHLDSFVKTGHDVTVVSTSTYHYYSGMGPGMLGGTYRPQEIRFNTRKMVADRGGRFVEESVKLIDPPKRTLFLASGEEIHYDVVSFNTGSHITKRTELDEADNIFTVKPIINLLKARQTLLKDLPGKDLRLTVIGGGPAGVEITGNLWRLVNNAGGKALITFIAGSRLMKAFPGRARRIIMKSFERRGIRILENVRAAQMDKYATNLSDGRIVEHDFAFLATGVTPSPLFRDSGIPVGNDGGMLVNDRLQSVEFPEIFGGGDCINLEGKALQKVGVYAVRENPVLLHNISSVLNGGPMMNFEPGGAYLLIFNLGDNKALLWKWNIIFDGRLAFAIKDRIDRNFMAKFQVSGERGEE